MAWNSTVGDIMSKRSKIFKFEHYILFVRVVDHVWQQEFLTLKPKILQDIRDNTGLDIKNILFVV